MEEKHETKKKRTKPFNSFSVLAKATTWAQRAIEQALSKIPNRRKAVQREIFRRSAIQNDAGDKPIERPKLVHTLSDDLKQQVENFYRRDDISRQAPCRKDVVSVKENGSCTKYQTRHLTSSVNKAFCSFPKGQFRIKSSNFCRTSHPYLSKFLHFCTICRYHSNMRTLKISTTTSKWFLRYRYLNILAKCLIWTKINHLEFTFS